MKTLSDKTLKLVERANAARAAWLDVQEANNRAWDEYWKSVRETNDGSERLIETACTLYRKKLAAREAYMLLRDEVATALETEAGLLPEDS